MVMRAFDLRVVMFSGLVAFTGCGASQTNGAANATPSPASAGAPPASTTTGPASAADTNGRSIYAKGKDLAGQQIVAAPPAMFPSCAACHNLDGSGGKHLPGGAVSADLRHAALVTHQKVPYTLALLERAISTGVDNLGQPLNPVMPRWKLSAADLHDVAEYVLTQLK